MHHTLLCLLHQLNLRNIFLLKRKTVNSDFNRGRIKGLMLTNSIKQRGLIMKKFIYLTVICFSFMSVGTSDMISFPSESIVHAQRPTPPYAKWGNIAVQRTKEKYPDAEVVDYLHIGRVDEGNNTVEKFKLWLKGQNREFGVLWMLRFNKSTEETIRISFREVAR